METTMMAIRAHKRGGPDQLVYEECPRPVPKRGEVLVAVYAAAITFAELTWEETWTRKDGSDRTPIIPSHEFSGMVSGIGEEVTELSVGDEVYGLVPFDHNGAAAEYVTVAAAALARKPRSLTHIEAAAVPLASLTAWQALVDQAALAPGDHVLVHGGSGGVGAYVVQLATLLGAHVTTTVRGDGVDLAHELGAQRVIDFEKEAFSDSVSAMDVVIDTVGTIPLELSFAVMRRGGRFVRLNAPPSQDLAREYGVTATFFVVHADRGQLEHIAGLIGAGELRVLVANVFPLKQAREAFGSGTLQRPGKTVLSIR